MAEFEIEEKAFPLGKDDARARMLAIDVPNQHHGVVVVVKQKRGLKGGLYCIIETHDWYEPVYIPALIAALERAREIAAQWAAESEASDDNS